MISEDRKQELLQIVKQACEGCVDSFFAAWNDYLDEEVLEDLSDEDIKFILSKVAVGVIAEEIGE